MSNRYVQTESLYHINKNRQQIHRLQKYREFLDRQEAQKMKEFHREKANLKKFLNNIHTTTGCLEETSLATRKLILHGRISFSYRKETHRTLPEVKARNVVTAPAAETIVNAETESKSEEDEENSSSDEKQEDTSLPSTSKSYAYVAAKLQAKSITNASRRLSRRSSISSHYSDLADSLNNQVRGLKPLPVVESNRVIFSKYLKLDRQLTYGSLSKQKNFKGSSKWAQINTMIHSRRGVKA